MNAETTTVGCLSIWMFPDGRFNTQNAALYLGLKEKTLAIMRGNGTGPKFIKRGRIFYFKDDLDNWLNANGRLLSTAQGHQKQEKARLNQEE